MTAPSLAGPEQAIWFDICGSAALGVLHPCTQHSDVAVLIVVGGPQYRVGSHRQFVLLARDLAAAGFPVLRFDYRGMGDSSGEPRGFQNVDDDLAAAARLLREQTQATRVVLLGLCDAASAILMHSDSEADFAAMVLLNPWVHSEQTEAEVRLKSYYPERLSSRDLWSKIVRRQFDFRSSVRSFIGYWREAVRGPTADINYHAHYVERMLVGLKKSEAPLYLILSGDDLTTEEFINLRAKREDWRELMDAKCRGELTIPEANHTFARREWRNEVAAQTIEWLREIRG